MKNALIYVLFSVLLLIFIPGTLSQSTGSTVINATVVGNLSVWIEHPEIIIPEDYYFYGNITAIQTPSGQNISVYFNKTDTNSFMSFVRYDNGDVYYEDDYTTQLIPNTPKNITFRVFVPDGMGYDGGTYDIFIYASSLNDSRSDSDTIKVHVNSTNPIDDIEILNIYPSSLYSGQSLTANISIHKISPNEITDIQICYCIDQNPAYLCGPSYNDYGCSWKAIKDWLNYTKTVTVNENPGDYYFIISINYPNDQNIKRANSPVLHVLSTTPPSGGAGLPSHIEAPDTWLVIDAPDYIETSPGDSTKFQVLVKNTWDVNAPDTSLKLYGIPENWVYVSPPHQDISSGQSKNYSVSIILPMSAPEQTYYPSLVAKSGTSETSKDITMIVAMTVEKRAKFFFDEAKLNKREAEGIIDKCQEFGMNIIIPESIVEDTNPALDTAERVYQTGFYNESIEKSKEAIDGYKKAIDSSKKTIESAYLVLLDEIANDIENPEYTEENVIENVKAKLDRSVLYHIQGMAVEAYETILDARQLLDEMKTKRMFAGLISIIIVISIILILVTFLSMFLFYRKRTMKFMKMFRIEEHKKNLGYLFKRKVSPGHYVYKEKPKEEKPTEKKGIYTGLSEEEKKLVSKEDIRSKLYKKKPDKDE